MRALYLLPAAFIMGIEGFDLFAPYLILLLVIAYLIWRLDRRRRLMVVAIPVRIGSPASESGVVSLPSET